ncbi:phBC6A51 family helix-turn-helix protein [Sporosarcina sp. P17b]|uniref:phBC6A51 family helix-turn-helix protein n=1 Tax=Sporosarcina sp. P17b TaxID=2048260 RepID=UPI000C16D2B7|nr:phBC6A51 family helix-turn-helix protein [Sporosarcina sp. P17b]PIC72415.1 hypothetical protein CSV76_15335 [Sporosarcina sp. P17b]
MSMIKLPHDKEAAAQLLATGGLEKQEVARQLGIGRSTLWKWETQDDVFAARVDELKHEFESFAKGLIQSKLVTAVEDYWKLIKTCDNARVSADGYRFFIENQIGKPTSRVEVANTTKVKPTEVDILQDEFEEIDNS